MAGHASESYFVIGEGLLDVSAGGRALTEAADANSGTPPFRFSRMGPRGAGRQIGEPARKRTGVAMCAGGGGTSNVPAGYTYLGQFVDHDLTFDKTTVMFGQQISANQLVQGRSPSVDLDSLYGNGPQDPGSARFYEADGLHLKKGETVAAGDPKMVGFDLPRGAGSTKAEKRKAVIPDFRNDENLVVAQTHLAFIRFHNRIVDTLPASTPQAQRFTRARELAVKHYQWMLRHDYLPRICAAGVLNDVFNNGRKAFEVGVPATDVPTMPIEFSVAAFRLGHSMVRRDYNWNARFPGRQGTLDFLFLFSGTSGDPPLGGDMRLPSNWIADWRRMYDLKGDLNKDNLAAPGGVNKAMRINTLLVNPLRNLPTGSFGGPAVDFNNPTANLAFRNLTRARMVKLATGQQMARFLKNKGVNVTPLTSAQIRNGNDGATLDELTPTQRQEFVRDTPLWFYVLREAELNNGKLKGVGARIVAETFHRAIQGSADSILRDPAFRPKFGPDNNTFRMSDLLFFAFEGKRNLLAPLQ
jgi:Animal haem peroxidase